MIITGLTSAYVVALDLCTNTPIQTTGHLLRRNPAAMVCVVRIFISSGRGWYSKTFAKVNPDTKTSPSSENFLHGYTGSLRFRKTSPPCQNRCFAFYFNRVNYLSWFSAHWTCCECRSFARSMFPSATVGSCSALPNNSNNASSRSSASLLRLLAYILFSLYWPRVRKQAME